MEMSIILGYSFMRRYNLMIDLQNDKFIPKRNTSNSMLKSPQQKQEYLLQIKTHSIQLLNKCTIPSNSVERIIATTSLGSVNSNLDLIVSQSSEFSNLDSELNIHEQIVSPMEGLIPIIIENRSSRDIKMPKMVIGSAEIVNRNNPSLKTFVNTVSTTESDFKDRTKPLRKEEVKEFLNRFRLDNLYGERRIQMEKLLIENHDVFAKSAFDLSSYSEDPFHIEVENSIPVRIRPYPIPFHLHKVAKDEIDRMLACGVIEPCNSPYLAPLLLVKKKDGTHRLVTDYRELNKVIKKDSFPMLLISEILDSLGGCSVFSNLDSICGYWQVLVDEDSRDVTAFSAPGFETYRYKKIPQGICSAPAHFSRVANRLMALLLPKMSKLILMTP